ncbi:MAG: UDP-2,4-diacetamido-2,4,6-trideoxy-beta-L-altropyranose hydrolase [Flavobacteriales bacterium]|nr:UDP-2,4-diacetamido-2,4,6-trideoxy-beta-L-altropyranose hydrolase [Flavobacteriales bacterium]MBT7749647.1 UDP-2,4-diacetamido-2,4,6-trideoxy-beta-L-altropyranose hydrolase [Flavobacteriales bacterium]
MDKIVVFRVDGSLEIGFGHVVRTISLAQMLRNSFDVHFYILKGNPIAIQIVKEHSLKVTAVTDESDFVSKVGQGQIAVFDSYHVDESSLLELKQNNVKLVYIDDLLHPHNHFDIVINQTLGIEPADYPEYKDHQLVLGPEYALLRSSFLEYSRPAIEDTQIKSVFICFGGSDPQNFTGKVLDLLSKLKMSLKIVVVVGKAYHHDLVRFQSEGGLGVLIMRGLAADDMVRVMSNSDLLIVSASSILVESMAISKPIITGYTAENQRSQYNAWVETEAVMGVEDFKLDITKEKIQHSQASGSFAEMIDRQRSLIDLNSKERLLEVFKNL